MSVFLSYSFREEDKESVARVRETLEDFGLETVTGEHLGGEQLEAEIKRRISK
jgi:hypothetical protein